MSIVARLGGGRKRNSRRKAGAKGLCRMHRDEKAEWDCGFYISPLSCTGNGDIMIMGDFVYLNTRSSEDIMRRQHSIFMEESHRGRTFLIGLGTVLLLIAAGLFTWNLALNHTVTYEKKYVTIAGLPDALENFSILPPQHFEKRASQS